MPDDETEEYEDSGFHDAEFDSPDEPEEDDEDEELADEDE
jgi:hypothetical protein